MPSAARNKAVWIASACVAALLAAIGAVVFLIDAELDNAIANL